jgi:hypothetical protein
VPSYRVDILRFNYSYLATSSVGSSFVEVGVKLKLSFISELSIAEEEVRSVEPLFVAVEAKLLYFVKKIFP